MVEFIHELYRVSTGLKVDAMSGMASEGGTDRGETWESPPYYLKDEFIGWVRDTGRPEDYSKLCRRRLARSEQYTIIAPFSVDRKQRPDGYMIPCAICRPGHEKCLNGNLVYGHNSKNIYIVGHNCADSSVVKTANDQFKHREALQRADDYLLRRLPLLPGDVYSLELLQPSVREQARVYTKLKAHDGLLKALRSMSKQHGSSLVVADDSAGGVATTGGMSKGAFVDVAVLRGTQVALSTVFDPLIQYESVLERYRKYEISSSSEIILSEVAGWADSDRIAAAKDLDAADSVRNKLLSDLVEFSSFFDEQNFSELDRWGQDVRNARQVSATVEDGIYEIVDTHGEKRKRVRWQIKDIFWVRG